MEKHLPMNDNTSCIEGLNLGSLFQQMPHRSQSLRSDTGRAAFSAGEGRSGSSPELTANATRGSLLRCPYGMSRVNISYINILSKLSSLEDEQVDAESLAYKVIPNAHTSVFSFGVVLDPSVYARSSMAIQRTVPFDDVIVVPHRLVMEAASTCDRPKSANTGSSDSEMRTFN